jgi:uncharacterized oxidoreductase
MSEISKYKVRQAMRLTGNTVLITGGSSGIGYSLAKAFLDRGNTVIICGRSEDKLLAVQRAHPEIHIRVCDVSIDEDRRALATWVTDQHPDLNVLINNAGIQHDIDFNRGADDLIGGPSEIDVNINGTVYLSAYLIPHLKTRNDAVIINNSSCLAFTPMARVPVYCATKAFIHNFTLSLRFQLHHSGINVFELLPPRVKTELNIDARRKMGYADTGVDPDDFVSEVMEGLENDVLEIEYPEAISVIHASRTELDELFMSINKMTFNW